MQIQSMWTRFFLLFALVLAVVAQPVDRSASLQLRQDAVDATDAAPSAVPSGDVADDPANDVDIDSLFKRKGGRGGLGGLGGLFGGGSSRGGSSRGGSSSPPPRPESPPPAPAPPAPEPKPATPPPAPPAQPKPDTPDTSKPDTSKPDPNAPKPPPKNPKPKQPKGKGSQKKPLPTAELSNGAKNRLKNSDILFFSGTKDKAGTAKAKKFAKDNNMKTINDAFPAGTFDNFNNFDGTKEEKTAFLQKASENFAKAVPKATTGKVFAMFPGDKPPADGIFSKFEAPALKDGGHTSLTKLDFDKVDTLDPKTATDQFDL